MNYKDCSYENYKLIFDSCLFDEKWYVESYIANPNVDENFNPIFHFLLEGAFKGFNPNPIFSTTYYLMMNKDVKRNGMNPLIHYIKHGKKEKRPISPNFAYDGVSLEEKLLYDSINYDPEFMKGIDKIKELKLFDYNWYLKENKDAREANVDPLVHYIKIGAKEKRNPSPTFDTHFYLRSTPPARNDNTNPLIYYALHGFDGDTPAPTNDDDRFSKLDTNSQVEFLFNRVNKLEKQLKKEMVEHEKILESYHEYFNLLYLNENLKADGVLRYIQLQTFEMLKYLVKLCEKNDITYWLDYGTLIGAIRHKGYVPWDDEIDICMLREDYEKFVKILLNEIEKNEHLRERVKLRLMFRHFRTNKKSVDAYPAPTIQFVESVPLANVDIHVLDYYELNAFNAKGLLENRKLFNEYRDKLSSNILKNPDNIEKDFIKVRKEMGITDKKSKFVGYSLDDGYRTPTDVDYIFPLRKVSFEGSTFNAPNMPIEYLSNAYYTGDIMKIPKVMHDHGRTNHVLKQLRNKDIDAEFKKVLSFWRWMNSSI